MKKLTIKKLGWESIAKVSGALYALLGLIPGLIISLLALVGASAMDSGAFGVIFGVGALIFFPVLYGIMGFLLGAIVAFLFNLVAPRVGGIVFEAEEEVVEAPQVHD